MSFEKFNDDNPNKEQGENKEKEQRERMEELKKRTVELLEKRFKLLDKIKTGNQRDDRVYYLNNKALIAQVEDENFFGGALIPKSADSLRDERGYSKDEDKKIPRYDTYEEYEEEKKDGYELCISQSFDAFIEIEARRDNLDYFSSQPEVYEFLKKQKNEANEIIKIWHDIINAEGESYSDFYEKHSKSSKRNFKFEDSALFRRAYDYVKSKFRYGGYVNSQEKINRVEESIRNGDYSDILEEYENRKGSEFEETLRFKQAWDYLMEKYPFRDKDALAELRGQDNVDARRRNDIRNDLETLKDLGYYEELLAFYRKDVNEEQFKVDELQDKENKNKQEAGGNKQEEKINIEPGEKKVEQQDEVTVENYRESEEKKEKYREVEKENENDSNLEKQKMTERESQQEKERRELLALISQEGGFRAITSMPQNKETLGSGFYLVKDKRSLNNSPIGSSYQFYPRDNSKIIDVLSEKGLNEFAMIEDPLMKNEYETVNVKESSLFGLLKKTKQEERFVRERQILHSEIVQGGKDEACVPFRYYVFSQRGYEEKDCKWTDYMKGGRDGQQLELEVLLPKSTASKLQKLMNTDPIIVREIVEHFMKKKLTELYNGDVWNGKKPKEGNIDPNKTNYDFDHNNPLRPPWEEWDKKKGGGRIYIPENVAVVGWKNEFVKDIKKRQFI